MKVDVRTMYFSIAATCFIVAAALFMFQAGRFRRDGTLLWILGWISQSACWSLIGLRGVTWDFVSIVISSTLLTASYSFFYAAVREFQGHPCSRKTFLFPATVTFLFFWYFSVYADNVSYRIIFLSLLIILQISTILWALFRGRTVQGSRSRWVLGFAFFLSALIFLIRLLEGLSLPYEQMSVLVATAFRSPSFFMALSVVIISSIGFILMIRERAEESLRESQTLLSAIIESTPDPVYVKDSESRIVMANQALARVVGKRLEEILGKTDSEYYGDVNAGQVLREHDLRVMKSGQSEVTEETVPTPEGYRIFLSNKTPYRNASGDIIGITGISRDITERKRAEEALRESRERFATMFQMSPVGIFFSQRSDGLFLEVNEAYLQTIGYERQEVIDRTPWELNLWVNPRRRNHLLNVLDQEGHFDNIEIQCRRKSGEILDVRVTVLPIELGGESCLIGTLTDITERKRAEKSLRDSEATFRAIGELNPFGTWECDPHGHVVYLSQSCLDMMGMSLEECKKFGWMDRYAPGEGEKMLKAWRRCRDVGERWEYEHQIRDKEGAYRWILSRGFPLRDHSGRILKWVGLNIDMTERKWAEEVLHRIEAAKQVAEAIEAERQRLFDVLETLPVILTLLKPDHRVEWANLAYRKALGDNAGRLCHESQFGREKPCPECQAFMPLLTGQPHNWEWTLPNGRIFEVYNFPFADPDGSPLVLEMDIDITERRETDEALRKVHEQVRFFASQCLTAQERERRLIAGEIHDSIGASLAATKFKVEEVITKVGKDSQTKAALKDIVPIIQEAIHEARRIQMALRPSMLDDIGILATINWFCRQFKSMYSHIHIEQEINIEEAEVADSLRTVIYRIFQEALNNIAKHSKADRIILLLRKVDGAIELRVEDNGQGFDPEEMISRVGTEKGLGLDSMRERAELSGGSLLIESRKGVGTIIRAKWSLNSESFSS